MRLIYVYKKTNRTAIFEWIRLLRMLFDDLDKCLCSFEYCIKNGQYSTAMDVDIAAYQEVLLDFRHLRSSEGQNLTGLLTSSEYTVNKL